MAYRTLALKYHQDRYKGDPSFASEQMKRINAAYHVLCDPDERRKYDDFLRLERSESQKAEGEPKKQHKPKKEKTPPTLKRSMITVGILLFLALALEVSAYIFMSKIEDASVVYAIFLAFFDFILLTLGHMFFPMLVGSIKKECSLKFAETMSWINSVAFVILLQAITDSKAGSGWLLIIIYSVINKHVLCQMHQRIKRRKHRVIATCTALLVLALTLTGGFCGLYVIQNSTSVIAEKPKNATVYYIGDVYLATEKSSTYYVYEDGSTRKIKYTAYYKDKNGNLIKIDE